MLLVAPAVRAQVIVTQSQTDVPVIRSLSPPAIPIGTTSELTITGERLGGLHRVLCGASIELLEVLEAKDKTAKIRVQVAAEAASRPVLFHVLCKNGVSNPRWLRLDTLPTFHESEKNGTPATANKAFAPAGISGVLTAADRDCFRFHAKAGERYVFDLEAQRLGHPVLGRLALFDENNRRVAYTRGKSSVADPRMAFTFPKDGEYVIRVDDGVHQGGPACQYYLRIAPVEYAETMFPLGGQRGSVVNVSVAGGSLEQSFTQEIDLKAAVVGAHQTLWFHTEEGDVIESPMRFAAGDFPEMIEQEPQNDKPTLLKLPVTVNGRIREAEERDAFRFTAKSGQKFILRVQAQELGSSLDAVLTMKDSKGKTLSEADDVAAADSVPPVVRTATASPQSDDPRIEFSAPADGEYTIQLRDRFGHGGDGYAYRLSVSEPTPDFELLVQPGKAVAAQPRQRRNNQRQQTLQQFDGAGTGSLSIDRGGRGSLVVKAVRRGYDGVIKLAVANLPQSLTAREVSIPAGQTQVTLPFDAGFDAESEASFVQVVGTGLVNGREIIRPALQPVIFSAMPFGVVVERHLDTVAVAVSGRGAELALQVKADGEILPGGSTRVKLAVRRREGVTGAVTIKPVAVPTHFSLKSIVIPADKNEATVDLSAAVAAAPGLRAFQLEATLQPKKKKGAKKNPEPLVAGASLSIKVRPLLALELATQQVEVAPGKTATVTLKLTREGDKKISVALNPSRLPRGTAIKTLTVPDGSQEFPIEITAAPTARPSAIRRIIQLKPTATVDGVELTLPTLRFALKVVRK